MRRSGRAILGVGLTILAVLVTGVFIWPTPWTETIEFQPGKSGAVTPVHLRTNRFSGEVQHSFGDGKWLPGRVLID